MVARFLGYLVLVFLAGIALAAAAELTIRVLAQPPGVLPLLGALACLAGTAIAGMLAYALLRTRLRHDFHPPAPSPAKTLEELKAECVTASKTYRLAKSRYEAVLARLRDSGEEEEAMRATRAELADAREAMLFARRRRTSLAHDMAALTPAAETGKGGREAGAGAAAGKFAAAQAARKVPSASEAR